MLWVYLDQLHWVHLRKAEQGIGPDHKKLTEVAELAAEAAARGHATFPLSPVHYYEVSHRRDPVSRLGLASTMFRLSRNHTMAGASLLVPAEVDQAVAEMTGASDRGLRSPAIRPFGMGARHAFGLPETWKPQFDESHLIAAGANDRELQFWRAIFPDLMELGVLAGGPVSSAQAEELQRATRKGMRANDQLFVDAQVGFRESLEQAGQASQLEQALTATELADVRRPLVLAALRYGAGPPFDWLTDPKVQERLLRAIPSKWAVRQMRLVRHRERQKSWSDHDLNDVAALSGAVVYCDVVVTEKEWAHQLRQGTGLARQHNTIVTSKLPDLIDILVQASR